MTPAGPPCPLQQLLARVPVIPVVTIEDESCAEPLAAALVDGGLPIVEVTLRTPAALPAISRLARLPGCTVGAGTLLTPGDVADAKAAGAAFGVSPGATIPLIDACRRAALPLLPGAATASEIMRLRELGFGLQKFFPAESAGGISALKALSGPLPDIVFCPTGGIGLQNAPDYLALGNVVCVGGSWVAPSAAIQKGDWEAVAALAAGAAELGAPQM